MIRMHVQARRAPRGAVLPAVAIALTVLLGLTGFAIDFGMVSVALQQCQTMADAGALGGSQDLPDTYEAQTQAQALAQANVHPDRVADFTITTATYTQGQDIPGTDAVAPLHGAIEVTVSTFAEYRFLRVLGFDGMEASRSSVATRYVGNVAGAAILPMWIWHTTPVEYGVNIQLLMATAPHVGIPGSFGFLEPQDGVDFRDLMRGTATPEQEEAQRLEEGDHVWAKTGLRVAQWRDPLRDDWNSRLNRATWEPWAGDTFDDFRHDNPRIMIVPMVEYVGGTGANAHFVIHDFGAFWLEEVVSEGPPANRRIGGRFVDYAQTGAGGGGYLGDRPGRLIR